MPPLTKRQEADRAAGRPFGASAVRTREKAALDRTPAEARANVWIGVRSSWIRAVRYDTQKRSLDVMLKTGKIYPEYPNCTPQMFRQILRVISVGKWMWRHYPPRHTARAREARHIRMKRR